MALARIKTWAAGEVLTAADLNAEFANPLNNSLALISPLTGNLDANTNQVMNASKFGAGTSSPSAPGHFTVEDTRTNTVVRNVYVGGTTTGAPAAGIGTGILVQAESGDESPSDFGALDFAASDVTAASEDTYAELSLRVAGAALTAVYRWVATGAFNAIFTHANSAARTYTLPNATTNIVGHDTTDTLSNKTISSPVLSGTATGTYTLGGTPSFSAISTGSTVTMGTGAGAATFVGVANVNTTSQATTGTSKETLASYSLPANSLSADGKAVRIRAWAITANNGNSKTLDIDFGATNVSTIFTNTAANRVVWAEATVIRTGAATQEAIGLGADGVSGTTSAAIGSIVRATPGETTSGAITIAIAGTTPTALGDLTFKGLTVEFLN